MDYMAEFAQRLKAQREKLNLTQAQLAEKICVTSQTISAYEKNSAGDKGKTPTLDKAVALAQALGVSLDHLCGLDSTGKDCSMESLRDVVECLTKISSYVECYGSTRVRHLSEEEYMEENSGFPEEYAIETKDMAVFTMDDATLANYFKTKNKLQELFNDGTIDRDLYGTIIEGQLAKLQNYKVTMTSNRTPGGIKADKAMPK